MDKLKERWKKSKMFRIIAIVFGLVIIAIFFSPDEKEENKVSNEKKIEKSSSNEAKRKIDTKIDKKHDIEKNEKLKNIETNEIESNMDNIYKQDEKINVFLNKYNNLYPERKISSKDVQIYHHHGKDHTDQVSIVNSNLEITLTNELKGISVFLKRKKTDLYKNVNYKFKDSFDRIIKMFDNKVSDEKIDYYWKEFLDTKSFKGEKVSGYGLISIDNNNVEYIKIEGEI